MTPPPFTAPKPKVILAAPEVLVFRSKNVEAPLVATEGCQTPTLSKPLLVQSPMMGSDRVAGLTPLLAGPKSTVIVVEPRGVVLRMKVEFSVALRSERGSHTPMESTLGV